MRDEPEEKITVSGLLLHETDKAFLLEYGAIKEWFPKSQITRILRLPEDRVELDIPLWLAKKKGLE